MINKKAKRTIDLAVFAFFSVLAYQSFHSNEITSSFFYVLGATAIAAAVVVETE